MLNMRKKAKPLADYTDAELYNYFYHNVMATIKLNIAAQRTYEFFYNYLYTINYVDRYLYSDMNMAILEERTRLIKDPLFQDWLKNVFIPKEVADSKKSINENVKKDIVKDTVITIYRGMKVREDYIQYLSQQGKHLGIYWTTDISRAYERDARDDFSETGRRDIILESYVKDQYIDWKRTTYTNSYGFGYKTEKEITLYKGTPLQLVAMYDGTTMESLDITPIAGKVFYA